jgi:epoxyqueuosine reductase
VDSAAEEKTALILEAAEMLGLEAAITDARPLPLAPLLEKRRQAGLECPFETGEPEDRCRPDRFLPGARSVLVAAMPYARPWPRVEDGPARGVVSRYAWGEDYHRVLLQKLEEMAHRVAALFPGARYRIQVDAGPLPERYLAWKAGLGWVGRNGCFYTERHGSYVLLGILVTDAPLLPGVDGEIRGAEDECHPVLLDRCGSCRRCIEACPTGALREAETGAQPTRYFLDYRLCLAYLTQARDFPLKLRPRLGRRLWGCDTCQDVCPWNRGKARGKPPSPDLARPRLEEVARLTRGEFRRRFGGTAASWRGPAVLRRNARIILENLRKDGAEFGGLTRA